MCVASPVVGCLAWISIEPDTTVFRSHLGEGFGFIPIFLRAMMNTALHTATKTPKSAEKHFPYP